MGRVKALLPLSGITMVEQIAARVRSAAGKLDPVCAVYHRRLLWITESVIHRKMLKMQDFVSTLRSSNWHVADPRPILNVNIPAEWRTR
jgi:molybdopterin-guanine dinucleotide biosynthesis protein A